MKNINEKQIKDLLNNILENSKNETDKEYSDEISKIFDKIDLKDPEKLFYFYTYTNKKITDRAIELKVLSEGFSPSSYFSQIFYHFEDISHYLSNIVKKELGYACSTDKANFVLRRVMEYELKGKTIFNKGSEKSYADPFYRSFYVWRNVIRTCPIINQNKAIEHAEAIILLLNNIRKYKNIKNDFIDNFSKWLKSTEFKNETCEISKNKLYTYEFMFNQDPINAYEWVKAKSPHIVKIFKTQLNHR